MSACALFMGVCNMWNKKKRCTVLSLLLLISFLVLTCGGCKEKAPEKLHILIDLVLTEDFRSTPEEFGRVFQYRGGLNPDTLEIEFLPTEEAERTVRIQALRTEIMSGGGPDVFLMTCNFSGWRSGRQFYPYYNDGGRLAIEDLYQQDRLFGNVEKCMENRTFLPLDDFFEKAEYFDPNMILPAVLEAGRTDEGQMVLPITFTFPAAVYQKDIVQSQGAFPSSWQEAVDGSNRAAQKAYGVAAWSQFSDIFPELADTSGWELAVTKEELIKRVKEAVKLSDTDIISQLRGAIDSSTPGASAFNTKTMEIQQENRPYPAEQFDGFLSERSLSYHNMEFWSPGFYDYRWEVKEYSQIIEPIYNTDGGVTAGITTYACINRNTKHPEEAFRALDTLFCTDVQNGYGSKPEEYPKINFQILDFWYCYGVPARNDLMKDNNFSFQQKFLSRVGVTPGPNEEAFSEYTALRNEVTHARFYGTLDQELQTMYEACLEAESDEEIEKIVSKAYDTMLMILAES